jgi:hypothetical protein
MPMLRAETAAGNLCSKRRLYALQKRCNIQKNVDLCKIKIEISD